MRRLTLVCVLGLVPGCAVSGVERESGLPVRLAVEAEAFQREIAVARASLHDALPRRGGVAVAVRVGDDLIWSEGMGWGDADQQVPVDPARSRFRIYSLAKPMTAAAAARMMEQGALDPNAPVTSTIPGLPDHLARTTPMLLATHRGGIRHYADEEEAYSPGRCDSVGEALEIFTPDPLIAEPGATESYSSWGYVLLSAVLEAVSELQFPDLMVREVFAPVGMADTGLESAIGDGFFQGWEEEGGSFAVARNDNSCRWGAGGFVSTAEDVAAFGSALVGGSLHSPPALQLFLRGGRSYTAQGVGPGGTAFLYTSQRNGLTVAVLGNFSGEEAGPGLQQAFREIVEIFEGR